MNNITGTLFTDAASRLLNCILDVEITGGGNLTPDAVPRIIFEVTPCLLGTVILTFGM